VPNLVVLDLGPADADGYMVTPSSPGELNRSGADQCCVAHASSWRGAW